ncbi:MAG: amino acid permease [Corynebacterium sp.]|nr:amino acid permease [Corynebacterium sp.]
MENNNASTAPSSEGSLGSSLKTRHLTMMGLGSTIGAGLFLGTGVGIQAAGPAVLLAYIFAGFIVVCVMQMLGEMAAASPSTGSFAVYAEKALGHWAGFTIGWVYWFMFVMSMGVEITGASAIMHQWFGVPPWIPALVCVLVFTVINLIAVRGFGEFEFWFAFLKIAVIVVFIVVATLLWLGVLPGTRFVGLENFTEVGFAPNGIGGIISALLVVIIAFVGLEVITIAAAEAEEPRESIRVSVRAILWRILFFYLGSVLLICLLLPYSSMGQAKNAAESPFTQILAMANIPAVAGMMEIVIVVALLSAFNAQLYSTSRLLFAMSRAGNAPRILGNIDSRGIPNRAVWVSLFFAFVSIGLQYWNPPGLLTFLMNAVGGCILVIWILIVLSEIRMRRELEKQGPLLVKMWGYPVLPWIVLILLFGIGGIMLFDDASRMQIIAITVISAILIAVSFVVEKKNAARKAINSSTTNKQ